MFDLYLVTDEGLCKGREVIDIVRTAVEGGVTTVQLREKELDTRSFIERAKKILEILKPLHIPLIINDRIDVALAVGADGVHLGQKDMPYEIAQKILPRYMLVGLSVENMEHVNEANSLDVDYLGVSPIFSTPTKTDFEDKPWGIEGLQELRSQTKHKLVAIGGIKAENAGEVIKAGADGIAVVSGICSAPDPSKAASELRKIINKAKNKQ